SCVETGCMSCKSVIAIEADDRAEPAGQLSLPAMREPVVPITASAQTGLLNILRGDAFVEKQLAVRSNEIKGRTAIALQDRSGGVIGVQQPPRAFDFGPDLVAVPADRRPDECDHLSRIDVKDGGHGPERVAGHAGHRTAPSGVNGSDDS